MTNPGQAAPAGRLGMARRLPRPRLEVALFVVLLAALAWLVLPPLLVLIDTSLHGSAGKQTGYTLDNYDVVLRSLAGGPELLVNSLVFAFGGAIVAVILGTTMAWLAERTNAPFANVAYLAAFFSFAVPGIIKIIAWIFLLGPNAGFLNVWAMKLFGLESAPFSIFSMGGMIMLDGISWAPVVFLLMTSPFRAMDPALEESAAMSGASSWWVFSRITFRLAAPTVAAVLLLTLVRSLQAFDIAALIGIPAGVQVFTTTIFLEITQGFFPSYGNAAAYSVVLVAIVGLALIPYYRLSQHGQKYATITGKGFRPRRIDLGRWRIPAGAVMLLLPSFLLLPVLVIIWASLLPYIQPPSLEALRSITLENFPIAFSNSSIVRSITNTLIVSSSAASAVVILTLVAAWVILRTRFRGRWIIDLLATLPLVFPGIVLGLAVLQIYLTVPIPIYGTIWIIAVAFVAKFLPYGMRYNHAGLLSIHRELEESAQMSGASFLMIARLIIAPLMVPAIVASWIYVFLVTSHELSEALLLSSPGNEILSITIWDLWLNGQLGSLMAFSVVITFALVLLAFVLLRFSRSQGQTI